MPRVSHLPLIQPQQAPILKQNWRSSSHGNSWPFLSRVCHCLTSCNHPAVTSGEVSGSGGVALGSGAAAFWPPPFSRRFKGWHPISRVSSDKAFHSIPPVQDHVEKSHCEPGSSQKQPAAVVSLPRFHYKGSCGEDVAGLPMSTTQRYVAWPDEPGYGLGRGSNRSLSNCRLQVLLWFFLITVSGF